MTREGYQKDLEQLVGEVISMGERVLAHYNMAIDSIRNSDDALVKKVDELDAEIDDHCLRLENHCLKLIASQQPVAGDLRLIASVFKLGTDLERIADMAVNVAEYAAESDNFILISKQELIELAERVGEMIEQSLNAFRAKDIEMAKRVIAEDDEIDELCDALQNKSLAKLVESGGQTHDKASAEQYAQNALTIFRSIRDLERIGDHAGNLCARLIYWQEADTQYI